MTLPIVHIVSLKKQHNFLVASAAFVLEPSCRVIEHESYEAFQECIGKPSDAEWQIVVTDYTIDFAAQDCDGAYLPVVCFSGNRHSENTSVSGQAPVFVGDMKPVLEEAIASATLFKKLLSGLKRFSELNERENAVMSLAASGTPNKTIAKRLNVSVKTIEQSRRNAYSKLGIKSSAEVGSLVTFKTFFEFFDHSIAPNFGNVASQHTI